MKRVIALALVGALGFTGLANCHGNFLLTRKWDGFVSGINNKWVRWIVFLLTSAIIPIYGLALLVDVLILNSIEFWTGSNPVAESEYGPDGTFVTVEKSRDGRAFFTYRDFGRELNIEVYKASEAGETKVADLLLFQDRPGEFFIEQDGRLQPLTAKSFFDGAVYRVQTGTKDDVLQDARLNGREYAELRRAQEELQARYAQ